MQSTMGDFPFHGHKVGSHVGMLYCKAPHSACALCKAATAPAPLGWHFSAGGA